MKTTLTIIVNVLLLVLFIVGLALPNFNHPVAAAQSVHLNASVLQTTPTPQIQDASVIGSTEGILVMGIVIVLIVTLPLLFRKKPK
jgi:hypothetical protein